jgi:hypothetical protein
MTGRAVGSIVLVLYCRSCRLTASIIEIFSGIARSGRRFSLNRWRIGSNFILFLPSRDGPVIQWRAARIMSLCREYRMVLVWGWWFESNACVSCSITCCEYLWSIYPSITLPLTLSLPCRRWKKWTLNTDNISVRRSAFFVSETTYCISVKVSVLCWVFFIVFNNLKAKNWSRKEEKYKQMMMMMIVILIIIIIIIIASLFYGHFA